MSNHSISLSFRQLQKFNLFKWPFLKKLSTTAWESNGQSINFCSSKSSQTLNPPNMAQRYILQKNQQHLLYNFVESLKKWFWPNFLLRYCTHAQLEAVSHLDWGASIPEPTSYQIYHLAYSNYIWELFRSKNLILPLYPFRHLFMTGPVRLEHLWVLKLTLTRLSSELESSRGVTTAIGFRKVKN